MKTLSRIIPSGLCFGIPVFLLLVANAVQAQFNYTTNNGTITITGYTGPGGDITVPSTINSLAVTRIGVLAFSYISSLTSVTMLHSVTNIGSNAFLDCTNLTSVVLPNSLTTIGGGAFEGCASLHTVTIPDSVVNVGVYAFYRSGLTNVILGSGVTNIGLGAFYYCRNLQTIAVDSLNVAFTSVDGVLFGKDNTTLIQCPGARTGEYSVADSVTDISTYAFANCSELTSITIGSTVTNIGEFALSWCSNLSAITVSSSNPFYTSDDGVLFDKAKTTLIQCPGAKAGNFSVPDGVTAIGMSAFSFCHRLTSVTIPDSVESLEEGAFGYCTSLTNATIGNGVTSFGNFTFFGCTSLTSITIPTNVASLGTGAFSDCASLTSITIPNSVTNMGGWTFDGCTSLKSAILSENVTAIGARTFSACHSLTELIIPKGINYIGDWAFYDCSSLQGLYFRDDAPSLGLFVLAGTPYPIMTVHYLPGTTGWNAKFGGYPTALWKPRILTADGNFGVRTNQFGFNISWSSGMNVAIDVCTDLVNPVWTSLQTNTLANDTLYFSDPHWANYPSRFYRLRWP